MVCHGLSSIRISSPSPKVVFQESFQQGSQQRSRNRGRSPRSSTRVRSVSRNRARSPWPSVKVRSTFNRGRSRRRESSRGWRKEQVFPENRFVTYYVEGIPPSWDQRTLFHAIDEWEDVVDTYIPWKRNAKGLRFGFVRFLRSRGSEGVRLKKLNTTLMMDKRLFFNIARFGVERANGRWRKDKMDFHSKSKVLEKERVSKPLEKRGREGAVEVDEILGKRDMRSFAEVVEGSPKLDGEDGGGFLNLIGVDSSPDWLNRSLVGTVIEGFKRLKEIPDKVEVRAFGGDQILLTFKSASEMEEVLKERSKSWISMFSDIHPWRAGDRSSRRLAWLQIRGIPLNAWNEDMFSVIVRSFGKLVSVDIKTSSFSRLDCARVCVVTDKNQNIDGKIQIRFDGVESQAIIKEETCWELPVDFCIRGGLGSNFGAPLMSPNSCTRAPARPREYCGVKFRDQEQGDRFRLPGGPRRKLWGAQGESHHARKAVEKVTGFLPDPIHNQAEVDNICTKGNIIWALSPAIDEEGDVGLGYAQDPICLL